MTGFCSYRHMTDVETGKAFSQMEMIQVVQQVPLLVLRLQALTEQSGIEVYRALV